MIGLRGDKFSKEDIGIKGSWDPERQHVSEIS